MSNRAVYMDIEVDLEDIPRAHIVDIQYTAPREAERSQASKEAAAQPDPITTFFYLAMIGLAVFLLAAAAGVAAKTVLPILAVFGGFGLGLLLIYHASTTARGSFARIAIYAAAFILLFEVIEFIDAIVAHPHQ